MSHSLLLVIQLSVIIRTFTPKKEMPHDTQAPHYLHRDSNPSPVTRSLTKHTNLSHVRTVIEESLALARQYPEADERLAIRHCRLP